MPQRALSLLQKKLPAKPFVVIEPSLKHDMDDLVADVLPRMRLAIVDDPNTAQAVGERVFRALQSKFPCTHIAFDRPPAADDAAAEYLRTKSGACDALIAVGGGAINDLCKYVSHAAGKPYIAIPTAASMNGYLSANASMTIKGYKQTVKAHMPLAVLCDMDVIAAAPARLNVSGFGDCLARPTAQADWLLSHLLLGTLYDAEVYAPLLEIEEALLAHARGIVKADPESLALLMKTLLISGLGMTAAGGSYPASQGEHMIAHAYNMLPPPLRGRVRVGGTLHGEEIGVTTLTMARMQEKLLHGRVRLRGDAFDAEKIATLFGAHAAGEAKKAFAVKYSSPHRGEAGRGADLGNAGDSTEQECPLPHLPPMGGGIKDWPAIAEKIAPVMLPAARLEKALKEADAPTTPQALGWDDARYDEIVGLARFLRDRFTFLDVEPA